MCPPIKNDVKRWSQQVTETSNALDLEQGVFSWDDPRRIARSLKWSADDSDRRKSSAFRSAMSMLNFRKGVSPGIQEFCCFSFLQSVSLAHGSRASHRKCWLGISRIEPRGPRGEHLS